MVRMVQDFEKSSLPTVVLCIETNGIYLIVLTPCYFFCLDECSPSKTELEIIAVRSYWKYGSVI